MATTLKTPPTANKPVCARRLARSSRLSRISEIRRRAPSARYEVERVAHRRQGHHRFARRPVRDHERQASVPPRRHRATRRAESSPATNRRRRSSRHPRSPVACPPCPASRKPRSPRANARASTTSGKSAERAGANNKSKNDITNAATKNVIDRLRACERERHREQDERADHARGENRERTCSSGR